MSEFLSHDSDNQHVHSDATHNNLDNGLQGESHDHRHVSAKLLLWCLVATFSFSIVEGVAGWWINSIALQSDAVHMMTDAAGLLIAFVANHIAKRPANTTLTFGYGKAEALGALINCMFTAFLTLWLLFEVVQRFFEPEAVDGGVLFIVAGLGLFINGLIVFVLSKNAHSLNIKAAMIHALGDLLGSVVAIVAGAVNYFTHWSMINPILSLIVIVLLLVSNYSLIKKSVIVLMAGVPEHLDYEKVGLALKNIHGIIDVHDLHIWYISANQSALAAHVVACDLEAWPEVLAESQKVLLEKYAITHVTLQAEFDDVKCREAGCCD